MTNFYRGIKPTTNILFYVDDTDFKSFGVIDPNLPLVRHKLTNAATNEELTNKNITSTSNNVIARGLWSGNGTVVTLTYASTPPLTGQVLTATSPTSAIWVTPGGSGSRKSFSLFSGLCFATDNDWKTIGYFSWLNSRYAMYTGGTVIYNTAIIGTNLDIRVFDQTNNTVLGAELSVNVGGTRSFLITNPVSDASLRLQIRKTTNGGLNPEISGISLEYD